METVKNPKPPQLPPKPRTGIYGEYQIACKIQRTVSDSILTVKKGQELKPADLASLARAWDILAERKRILKGRPLPGSLKPVLRKADKVTLDVEPLED